MTMPTRKQTPIKVWVHNKSVSIRISESAHNKLEIIQKEFNNLDFYRNYIMLHFLPHGGDYLLIDSPRRLSKSDVINFIMEARYKVYDNIPYFMYQTENKKWSKKRTNKKLRKEARQVYPFSAKFVEDTIHWYMDFRKAVKDIQSESMSEQARRRKNYTTLDLDGAKYMTKEELKQYINYLEHSLKKFVNNEKIKIKKLKSKLKRK